MISKIGPILNLSHLSASGDAPTRLHLLAAHAINFIVKVQRRANMIRNDAESIADAIATLRTRHVQMPVLLGKLFNHRSVIFLHEPEANVIVSLVTIRRE